MEGFVRSRGTGRRAAVERDLIEAGLNEPVVAGSVYGDCVAPSIADDDIGLHGDGWKGMARYVWGCPKRSPGATRVLAKIDAHEVAQALAIIAAAADLLRRALIEKPADQGELGDPVAVGEEAVVTDTMEAVGQANGCVQIGAHSAFTRGPHHCAGQMTLIDTRP